MKLHKLGMELCLFDINKSVCQSRANLGQFEFQSQIFTEHSFQSSFSIIGNLNFHSHPPPPLPSFFTSPPLSSSSKECFHLHVHQLFFASG